MLAEKLHTFRQDIHAVFLRWVYNYVAVEILGVELFENCRNVYLSAFVVYHRIAGHLIEYGNIFLENRYTDWGNYFPYRTLRNLWQLSRYVPAERIHQQPVFSRVFPGNPQGTLSEKIAYLISSELFPLADFYVDLHSGDIHESLHPYVYYPGQPTEELAAKARSVAKVLNVEYMVRSMATGGAYNYAASTGLPSILIERGGAGLCLHEDIEEYKSDLRNILRKLKLLDEPVKPRRYIPRDVTDIIYLEAMETGCWLHHIHSGDFVHEGQILGRTTDLFGETLTTYYAQQSGIVLYVCPALAAPKGTVLLAYGKIHNDD